MQFDVILADPPWHYRYYSGGQPGKTDPALSRGAAKHYPVMRTEDICALPVKDIAADNAVLYLWATWPNIFEAEKVIEAWGFKYSSLAWEWIKSNKNGMGFKMGMGFNTRQNPEPCLFARRGKGIPTITHDILAIMYHPILEHSRKPEDQYRRIRDLHGDGLRCVELFARREYPGWHVWGNEVESDINLEIKANGAA